MVARNTSGSASPYYNVHVELDNKALKAKNTGLTQTVAKLQQENADLLKQITSLQGESFEINSRYNNLKNVISIIDSTTKSCLPKLTEVIDTFTGIIQLCSVASNISNSNRDTRTQAVKPQIVNGHVLHNPTITLSRLESNEDSFTPPRSSIRRNSSNITVRPSTSRATSEPNDRHTNRPDDETDCDDEDDENNGNESGEHNVRCQANRGVCSRRQTFIEDDVSRLEEDDSDNSDEELEMPGEEDNEDDDSQNRLTTIQEVEEEEEENPLSPRTPRSKQRRFLKGRLQEVKIYLNQLPDTCVEQFKASGNISISLSPPERRSSYKNRSSSLMGEVNESCADHGPSFLEETISPMNRTIKMSQSDMKMLSFNGGQSNVSLSFNLPLSATSSATRETVRDCSESTTVRVSSERTSGDIATPSTSRVTDGSRRDSAFTVKGLNLDASSLQNDMSTLQSSANNSNSFSPSNDYESPNISNKNETSLLKSNITKRRNPSREKRKIAQVVLNRLSGEKRRSGSPIKKLSNIVNTPPITRLSDMKSRLRNSSVGKNAADSETSPVKINIGIVKIEGGIKKRKNDSPVKKARKIKKENLMKPKMIISPPRKNSPGRPKRAARPKTMKEPSLVKKMRRSK